MSRGYARTLGTVLPFVLLGPAFAAPRGGGGGAAPAQGTVQGVVVAPKGMEAPASQHTGFVQPIENPIAELRPFDVFPEVVVFLDGGPAAADAATPPRANVVWQLQSHAFTPALLPVVTGSSVEINNVGDEIHVLAPSDAGMNDMLKDPLRPKASVPVAVSGKDTAVRIKSRSVPHVEGRIVPLPTRYFARVERNGKFKIENVPPGRWTVRIWYRDGWANIANKTVDVPSRGDVKIDLTADSLKQPAQ